MSKNKINCPHCGNLIDEDAEICSYCGISLQGNGKWCPRCGQYISEESTVCPHCGYNMENTQYNSTSKQKQMLIVLIIILLIGLIVGAFVIIRYNYAASDSKEVPASPSTIIAEETATTESLDNKATDAAKNTYEQMLSMGNYTEALETILALDIASLSTEEKEALADTLSQIANGQYAQFEEHIKSLQNTGDFDSALFAVDEEAKLYNRLIENILTEQYVDISWPLEEKRVEIMKSHINYLLEMGRSETVLQWDEADLNSNVLDRLQGYVNEGIMTQEEFDRKRATIYGIFVNGKIASMGEKGIDAATILAYIVEKIADTGYNCQALEYWDYYMSVIGKGAGNPTLVSAKSADGYLLIGSDSRKLGVSDVSGLSRDELRLAIYEIFARHGYVFQDHAVNAYFGNCAWYHIDTSFEEENLNEYERSNLAMLVNCMFDKYL